MKNKEYILIGKCIWCLKTKPEAQFKTKPHTIPKSLNCDNIGFDICDSCNNYFGTDDIKHSKLSYSIDKVLKEFFNVHKFLLKPNKTSDSYKTFKSQFFEYYHKSKQLKIKPALKYKLNFIDEFTIKFKQGIYNIFLQELHRVKNNGHEKRFQEIRDFVRSNKGDLPLYYLESSDGIRIVEDLEISFDLTFNEHVCEIIDKFGFYHFSMTGLNFYLQVTNDALKNFDYMINDARKLIGSGTVFKKLIELKSINQIDFTLKKWNNSNL